MSEKSKSIYVDQVHQLPFFSLGYAKLIAL